MKEKYTVIHQKGNEDIVITEFDENVTKADSFFESLANDLIKSKKRGFVIMHLNTTGIIQQITMV